MLERFDRQPSGHHPRGKSDFIRESPTPSRTPERSKESSSEWSPDIWMQQMRDAGLVREPGVMSRRNFLLGSAALATATAVDYAGKFSPLAKWLDDKFEGQFNYDEVVKEAKQFLKERYGAELAMGMEQGQSEILGDKVTLEKYRTSLKILVREMSKYPPEMIQRVGEGRGLRIRVLRELRAVDKDAAGSTNVRRLGGLAPFLKQGKAAEFILNADETLEFQGRTVHHELNHRFAERWQAWQERDKKWTGFHAQVSPSPYRPALRDVPADQSAKERYFLTDYAGSAPVEDQAVSVEWMMTPRLMAEFLARWRNETDPHIKDVLAKKYVETKENYATWSNGRIGESFWQSIIDQGYKERLQK